MRLECRASRRAALQHPRRRPHTARSDAAAHGGRRHPARRHHLRRQRRADDAPRIRSRDRRHDRPARRAVPLGQGFRAFERHAAPPRGRAPCPSQRGQQHPQARFGLRRHGTPDKQSPEPGLFRTQGRRSDERLRRAPDRADDVPARGVRRAAGRQHHRRGGRGMAAPDRRNPPAAGHGLLA